MSPPTIPRINFGPLFKAEVALAVIFIVMAFIVRAIFPARRP